MHRFAIFATLVAFAAPALAQTPTSAPAPAADAAKPEVDVNGLINKPGHDVTVRTCSACHKPSIILSKHLDKSEWTDLVFNMLDRGAKATDEELGQIIDYLAANYPRETAAASPAKPAAQ